MADISKIKLPTGSEYSIKDEYARNAIASLNSFEYIVSTSAANTPKDVTWDNAGTTITGTLVASADTMYKIYLVPSVNGTKDIFDEYITVNTSGSTYVWEMFGNTDVHLDDLGDFAYVDEGRVTIKPKGSNAASSVTFSGGTTDKVLGEDTLFTNSTSQVTFGTHTKSTVLKSDVTATVPKTSSTTKYLKASASGTTVGVATSATAITDLGDASTDTFVKSYPGATSKLATTTVTGVSGSTTASKATAGTAVAVATTDTAKTVATGSLGTETNTRGADTPMWGATVSDEVLSFTFKPISTTSVTPAKSNGSITPYSFTDVTVPTAASSATTVATGSLSSTGSGGTVMTGLGTATTGSAVTGFSDVETDTFAKTVSVTAQPTVSLSSASSTSTGAVQYTESVSTSGTDSVTFDTTGHTADAITALGAGTAQAQVITVGTTDRVTAVTGIGTATAQAQTFTGDTETYTVYPGSE